MPKMQPQKYVVSANPSLRVAALLERAGAERHTFNVVLANRLMKYRRGINTSLPTHAFQRLRRVVRTLERCKTPLGVLAHTMVQCRPLEDVLSSDQFAQLTSRLCSEGMVSREVWQEVCTLMSTGGYRAVIGVLLEKVNVVQDTCAELLTGLHPFHDFANAIHGSANSSQQILLTKLTAAWSRLYWFHHVLAVYSMEEGSRRLLAAQESVGERLAAE